MTATVLIVDDDATMRTFFREMMESEGYEVFSAGTGWEGERLLREKPVDVVLLDLRLPDDDGLSILRRIKREDPNVQVIILTAYGAVRSAVEAMRLGAYDYLDKPADAEKLKVVVGRALRELALRREVERLRARPDTSPEWIVGRTRRMREIAALVARVAPTTTAVLLQGETGTGKEVVARAIHQRSPRADRPFTVINCAAIPEDLLESELFGFEAGAFTDAKRRKKGLLEIANGGTIFFDEIGEMQPQIQAKILRVLETKTLRRLGGTEDIRVDIRFIAASNRDLRAAVREGRFREDLFFRLSVVVIDLPPLRERMEDLDLFVATFLSEFNRAMGRNVLGVSTEAMELMRRYTWPGNIRELRNVIERAMVLCDGDEIRPAHLPAELRGGELLRRSPREWSASLSLPPEGTDLEEVVAQLERRLIKEALARTRGNLTRAAALLCISRDQLRYRLQKYGLLAFPTEEAP